MDKINEIWPEWQAEELLGTGSFGKVYKVRREKMGHISYAAVKVIELPQEMSEVKNLRTSGMDNSSIHVYYKDLIKDLMNEISVMESLKTANNIVAIEDYEVVEKKDEFGWIILIRMELLQNLGEYLEMHTMTEKDVMRLGIDICNALSSCEKENIIHRDIKIDNVFINTFGAYKLGDFGISKQLEKTSSAMSQKGTNMYMAPEIYRGEVYGSSVDIYSLGIMLYRILNGGRFPFMPPTPQPLRYDDTEKAMQRRLSGEPVPEIAGINKRLFQLIQKACAFDAAGRFSSAAELGRELTQLMADSESGIGNKATLDDGKRETRKDTYEEERTMAAFGQDVGREESEREGKRETRKDTYEGERTMAAIEQNAGREESERTQKKAEKEKITEHREGKKELVLMVVLLGVLLSGIVTGITLEWKQTGVLHRIKEKILDLKDKESDSVSEEDKEFDDVSEPIDTGGQSVSEVNVEGRIEDAPDGEFKRVETEGIFIYLKQNSMPTAESYDVYYYMYDDMTFVMQLLPGEYQVLMKSWGEFEGELTEISYTTTLTVDGSATSQNVGTLYANWMLE